jgi:hypothetical protein
VIPDETETQYDDETDVDAIFDNPDAVERPPRFANDEI